ncbi:hypothetical protein KAI46_13165 [bacterium]|nr:hypothetical protein [bacterium]
MKKISVWLLTFVFLILQLIVFTPDLFALQDSLRAINPIYQDRYESDLFFQQRTLENRQVTTVTCSSYAAFKSALHTAMNNREIDVSLHLLYSVAFTDVGNVIKQAIGEIEKSDAYLAFSWQGYDANYTGRNNDVVVTFVFRYDTTLAQEAEVSNRVNQILASILSVGMNDEEKAKAIHDWVVLNVAYDTSLVRHSIYAALFEGLAVCEGYALLMFKMLDSCSIQASIVSGEGNGGSHAWNLVYLCTAWFHVDATWDDPVPDTPGRVLYNYYNLSDNQIAADHTWNRSDYSAQAANTIYSEGICNNQNPGYSKTYYVPYLYTDDCSRASWTGMALANADQQSSNIQVSYYSETGDLLDTVNKTIPALGQSVFVAQTPSGTYGWIKIEASTNLDGLALIGEVNPDVMFDMDMKKNLHRRFLLPHLAADSSWRSLVMACNPNETAASLTYSYYNQAGQHVATKYASIPVNGSTRVNMYALFGQKLAGSMVIESNQPITAFMLYDSLSSAWQAGLSAVPLD